MEGLPFKSLFSCFPEALVVGLHNERTGYVQLNPPPGRLVQPGDHLITLRPGRCAGLASGLSGIVECVLLLLLAAPPRWCRLQLPSLP